MRVRNLQHLGTGHYFVIKHIVLALDALDLENLDLISVEKLMKS